MQLPQEFHAGQNITAAAILQQTLLESKDLAQRNLHRQVRNLVELAAVQQVESSSLHQRQAAASCPAGGASHCGRELSEAQHPPTGAARQPQRRHPLLSHRGLRSMTVYDARSVIQGWQQARHHANVDRAAARAEDARAYSLLAFFIPD